MAVAGGLADFAIGTDAGGSVRIPAALCGLWALRPTHGRMPSDGVVGLAPSLGTTGWFAREAQLLARVGAALLDPDPVPFAPRRLSIAEDAMALAEPAVRVLRRWHDQLSALARDSRFRLSAVRVAAA